MRKDLFWLLFACLFAQPIYTTAYHFKTGPAFKYTRYRQNCLPHQSGMMAGPSIECDINDIYCIDWHLGFQGLFDLPHICSVNGILIDSREYEFNSHFGYTYESEQYCYSLTPFVGIDFIYLRYQIHNNVMRNRYYQVNVPIGFAFNYQFDRCFDWGFKFYYDIDAWTRLKVTTPNECSTSEQKIKLERSHRLHLEAPFTLNFTGWCGSCLTLSWAPQFTWQKFGASECPSDLNIAELKQWHFGGVVALGIRF